MSKKVRRISNIKIYAYQYSIFILGAILFIIGIYMWDKGAALIENGYEGKGLVTSGLILLGFGLVVLLLSYIYARSGAKVIGTNCPYCHGTGYVDAGPRKMARKDVCPVCDGTGKFYSKEAKHLEELKREEELKKEENVN